MPHAAATSPFAALAGRRVLLTGHTGFKGGWLALWLQRLGARVVGVALPPPDGDSLHRALGLASLIDDRRADICDRAGLAACLRDVDAEIVIHMAAQALVRPSYAHPADTFATNVTGTAAVLDAARAMPALRAVIVVTSDKCYENNNWAWGYRELDRLGGADPYSASKACQELVADAYARSFFDVPDGPRLATVRAGNVIGGGDWSVDRLIPDIVRATNNRAATIIRNPGSVRPWQHVLDALAGYLTLAARMLDDGPTYAGAWNFGPDADAVVDVRTLAMTMQDCWGDQGPQFQFGAESAGPHEALTLRLDSSKARGGLGWRPVLGLHSAVGMTIDWYRANAQGADMHAFSCDQIDRYGAEIDAGAGARPDMELKQCA